MAPVLIHTDPGAEVRLLTLDKNLRNKAMVSGIEADSILVSLFFLRIDRGSRRMFRRTCIQLIILNSVLF